MQALTDKQANSQRLMADNTHLLADVAELHRSNRELSHKLADATQQLAAIQCQQDIGSTSDAACVAPPGSRPDSPALRQGAAGPSMQK